MKEFLGTTLGKVIALLAALVVFGGIGVALMLGGKDSDKGTQGNEGEGLIVIEEGEETDEDVIDASDWEDLTGESDDKSDDKSGSEGTGVNGNTNGNTNSNTNGNTNGNTNTNTDNQDGNGSGDDKDNDKVTDPSGESWGPFF